MKILYVTTIPISLIVHGQIIGRLQSEGNTVDIATNDCEDTAERYLPGIECRVRTLPWSRKPLDPKNVKAIGQLRNLLREGQYDIVHCHTPIAAA